MCVLGYLCNFTCVCGGLPVLTGVFVGAVLPGVCVCVICLTWFGRATPWCVCVCVGLHVLPGVWGGYLVFVGLPVLPPNVWGYLTYLVCEATYVFTANIKLVLSPGSYTQVRPSS